MAIKEKKGALWEPWLEDTPFFQVDVWRLKTELFQFLYMCMYTYRYQIICDNDDYLYHNIRQLELVFHLSGIHDLMSANVASVME